MFEPCIDADAPANSFRYRGVRVRFTYRVDIDSYVVGDIDIDGVMPGDDEETRWHRLRGPWNSRDLALADGQKWAARYIDMALDNSR